MLKKLRTVIYGVNDIVAAKQWYTLAIGVQPYFDEPFYVGFDINGYELGLDPNFEGGAGNQSVAYWAVDSVDEVATKLVDSGGSLIQARTNVGGAIHVAIVADPFGNHIGLIEGA